MTRCPQCWKPDAIQGAHHCWPVQAYATAYIVELLAEIGDWKLAAAQVSLAMAGTDISTPAAFQSAQASAATDLLTEIATLKDHINNDDLVAIERLSEPPDAR